MFCFLNMLSLYIYLLNFSILFFVFSFFCYYCLVYLVIFCFLVLFSNVLFILLICSFWNVLLTLFRVGILIRAGTWLTLCRVPLFIIGQHFMYNMCFVYGLFHGARVRTCFAPSY